METYGGNFSLSLPSCSRSLPLGEVELMETSLFLGSSDCNIRSLPLGEVELMETRARLKKLCCILSLPLGEVELMET